MKRSTGIGYAVMRLLLVVRASAAPLIDPLPPVSIPAGKSLDVPVTATSPNGRPLTYTVTSSTNRITVEVRTNNPFWGLSVAQVAPPGSPGAYETTFRGATVRVTNVGDMVFLLFRDRAPRAVDAITGLSHAGFFDRNTIFHRVITNFMIQGGDPATNGTGGPVFRYDDEFHPRSLFTGNGQLALANSGKDANGSQFFVTFGPQRHLDFKHTLFGQLLRGYRTQTNIAQTLCDTNNRPLRDVIILCAAPITNWTDTVITLTASNQVGVSGTIRVIADDGAGGRATNTFTATTVADSANAPPFLHPDTVTNRFAAANRRLTNIVSALDLEGDPFYWFSAFADQASAHNASNSFATLVNQQVQLVVVPNSNYVGPVEVKMVVSSSELWQFWPDFFPFDSHVYRFVFGDTEIRAWSTNFVVPAGLPFANQGVAFFTNGVPGSPAEQFAATIHWGDNTTNSGVVVTAGGVKRVLGAHTYPRAGHYPVEVTITSSNGARTTVRSTALVPPALQLSRWGTTNRLAWPSWAAGFQVQMQTNPLAAPWASVTNPQTVEGYNFAVTNLSAAPSVFFRLVR